MSPRPRPNPQAAPLGVSANGAERAMLRQADELSMIFKMLGNNNRLKILVHLDGGERTVSEIETTLKIRQPTLSQQLGELRDAGLIVGRRVAKSAIYTLTADRGRRALQTILLTSGSAQNSHSGETRLPQRPSILQAAVFASVIPGRKAAPNDWHLGFKSLLQE